MMCDVEGNAMDLGESTQLETERLVSRRMTVYGGEFRSGHVSDPDTIESTMFDAPADLDTARKDGSARTRASVADSLTTACMRS